MVAYGTPEGLPAPEADSLNTLSGGHPLGGRDDYYWQTQVEGKVSIPSQVGILLVVSPLETE